MCFYERAEWVVENRAPFGSSRYRPTFSNKFEAAVPIFPIATNFHLSRFLIIPRYSGKLDSFLFVYKTLLIFLSFYKDFPEMYANSSNDDTLLNLAVVDKITKGIKVR